MMRSLMRCCLYACQLEALVSALSTLPTVGHSPAAWVSFSCRDDTHLNDGSSLAGTGPKRMHTRACALRGTETPRQTELCNTQLGPIILFRFMFYFICPNRFAQLRWSFWKLWTRAAA
jgi:hypothetical protein